MNNRPNSQSFAESLSQGWLGKTIIGFGCLGILVLVFVMILLVGLVYIRGEAASQSTIFFRAPLNGAQVTAGQPVEIRVLARDDIKLKQVEVWADGQLVESQSSSLPGGSNPFPLLTSWNPPAGSHTLVARSVNSRNETAETTITIEALAADDPDADGVAGAADACPDQPGSTGAAGCPDRDADGIADATDACPDVAGLPESGCPAPSEGDRDGDGLLDTADTCPDEPGSPMTEGCPDADGDGIADRVDACPAEAGVPDDGCPIPGDADGDIVPDAEDACPHIWGSPETGGCPDADGDGVIDSEDLCPAEPGGADGCLEGGGDPPGGGDSGGEDGGDDGGDDDVEGVEGSEGGPFGDMGGDEAVDLVRVEALNFTVTQDYDEIYCYAGVVGEDMERYGPFDSLDAHTWDIVEYMGGANTRTLAVTTGEPLQLRVACEGNRGMAESFDLGSFTRTYDSTQWDGHVIEELSGATVPERGDAGHSFRMRFRLCFRSCEDATFPPPILRQYDEGVLWWTVHYLGWDWTGNRSDIDGYRLYVNGHFRETIHNPDASRLNMNAYMPECGERNVYTLSAYKMDGFVRRETPPSNGIAMEGETCPRRVKVTFLDLTTSGLDTRFGDMDGIGPISGQFWANPGVEPVHLQFDGGSCWSFLWVWNCEGYDLFNGRYTISGIFDDILRAGASCLGSGCPTSTAPEVDYAIIELDDGDTITFGGEINDEEAFGSDHRLFHANRTISGDEPLPAEFTLEDNNSYGNYALRVRIEEMP